MTRKIVREKIVEFRKKNNLTQKDLAEKLYVSSKTVSHWETGYVQPSMEQTAALAKLMEISVDELMGTTPEEKESAIEIVEVEVPVEVRVEVPVEVPVEVKRKISKAHIFISVAVSVLIVIGCFFAGFAISKKIKEKELEREELAKWQTTDKFEAEWATITAIPVAFDVQGNVENSEYASNGQCVAQFGVKENMLAFTVTSSKTATAKMYISVMSYYSETKQEYSEANFDEVWNLYVNPTEEQLTNGEFLRTNVTYISEDVSKGWYAFVEISVDVELKEGENVIKFVVPCTGNGTCGLNMDYIRFETDAVLKWKPYKENVVRPPDPPGVI